MSRTWSFSRSSVIPAPPREVWARVVTPEGINDEMRPWMTMSIPRSDDLRIDTAPVGTGESLGRALIRLFGLVPFDYDEITLTELEPGRRFREESTMLSMSSWIHDRSVMADDDPGTARVTDIVTLTPRLPLVVAGPVLVRVLGAFFSHRHRRLAAHFAGG